MMMTIRAPLQCQGRLGWARLVSDMINVKFRSMAPLTALTVPHTLPTYSLSIVTATVPTSDKFTQKYGEMSFNSSSRDNSLNLLLKHEH